MYLAGTSYTEVYSTFRWGIPPRFNIAEAVCSRYARTSPDAPALIYEQDDGSVRVWSFGEVERAANRFANALAHLGVERGTIVGIHLPQCPESLTPACCRASCVATALSPTKWPWLGTASTPT